METTHVVFRSLTDSNINFGRLIDSPIKVYLQCAVPIQWKYFSTKNDLTRECSFGPIALDLFVGRLEEISEKRSTKACRLTVAVFTSLVVCDLLSI